MAFKHFGEAGEVFHGRYFRTLLFQKLLGAAGRVKLHAEAAQRGNERRQPVFVVHRQQGGANGLVGHKTGRRSARK